MVCGPVGAEGGPAIEHPASTEHSASAPRRLRIRLLVFCDSTSALSADRSGGVAHLGKSDQVGVSDGGRIWVSAQGEEEQKSISPIGLHMR